MSKDVCVIEFVESLYGEVSEIMEELWALHPWDKEIKLSNGRAGVIKPFVTPRERDGRWEFGFDIIFTDGSSPDHLEFFVRNTGGGGMVMASAAPAIRKAGHS